VRLAKFRLLFWKKFVYFRSSTPFYFSSAKLIHVFIYYLLLLVLQTLHSLRDTDVLRVEPFIGYYLHPTAITAEAEEFACLFKNFKNNDTRMDLGRWRSDSYEHDWIENPYVSRIQGVTDNTLVIFNVTRSDGLVEDKPTLSLQKLGSNHEYSCCTSGESNTSMYFVVVGCNDPFCVTRRMVIRNLPGRVYL